MFSNHRVSNNGKRHGRIAAALVMAALILLITAPLSALATEPAKGVQDTNLGEAYHKADAALSQKAELERGDEGFWNYALSTLIIRFVGIFVVLAILQVVMQASGRFFPPTKRRKRRRHPNSRNHGPSGTRLDRVRQFR